MLSVAHRAQQSSRICLVAAGLALAATVGGCGPKTSEQRFDDAAQQIPGFSKMSVAKFSGKVLVDGQPPAQEKDKKLFVVLNNPDKLDEESKKGPALRTVCKPDGSFDFTTYFQGDGVPEGKYVVTFAKFGPIKTGRGLQPGAYSTTMYGGADDLKGLYGDPDKNVKDQKFVVNVEKPGKTDYEFDLQVAGKDSSPSGPHAIKIIKAN